MDVELCFNLKVQIFFKVKTQLATESFYMQSYKMQIK